MRLRIDMRPEPQRRPVPVGPFRMALNKKDVGYRKGLTLAILYSLEHLCDWTPCFPCHGKGKRGSGFCSLCKGLGARHVVPFPGGLLRVNLSFHVTRNTKGNLPDLDNLVKAVFDTGNGLLWTDDSQVRQSSIGVKEDSRWFIGIDIETYTAEDFDPFDEYDGYAKGETIMPVPRVKKLAPPASAKNSGVESSDVSGAG